MADHIISLNAKQEAAAQLLVDRLNTPLLLGAPTGTLTVDGWLRDLILAPIRQKIQELRDAEAARADVAAITDAYLAANRTTQDRVKTDLGIA